MLAACGGGAATTENPLTQAPPAGNAPYTGPVARDANVLKFQQEFWSNAKTTDRCGSCHNEVVGQLPMFVRNDDVNLAYDEALTVVDTQQPALSRLVEKVGGGHNCWNEDPSSCAAIMTTWIENWLGSSGDGGRQIVLTPPISTDPGASLNFPADTALFESTVYPVLTANCSGCHSSESATAQQPYFAEPDVVTAYAAAKSKINLDTPANSRLVIRLRSEFHNCWSGNCAADAQIMEDAIAAFAGGITPTLVDPNLITSKALRLVDGTLASGGNRYEDTQIALWEFKTGNGTIAYDTSGVDPAVDLNFSGGVSWFGGWGISITDGKAQASTTASAKLYDIIQESGEFSIEAWVIPANVTQEEARIVSYSAGTTQRNFTLQQTLYDYRFQLRTTETSLNGDPELSTPAADEVLQATLQHVVATYDPINGRRIYVNGSLVSQVDPVPGGTLIDWQREFALVLGNEASGDGLWQGTIRLAAIHRRAMTQEQITQNFDAGVGERFFLLFDISENIGAAPQSSYILFEAAQYDTYAYLFDRPHFVTLDGSSPEGIPIQGVRVAMNGAEARVGQTYATLEDTLSASEFVELGQPLSALGAVLPLEKGPEDDEFFLTFDLLAGNSFSRPADPTLVITATDIAPSPHVGLRTFDEINATYAEVTGVAPTTQSVDMTYQELRQSLPAVENLNTFLSSHQVAIAQLAIQYCDAMIGSAGNPGPNLASLFPGFNWNNGSEFSTNRDAFVYPLIDRIMGTNIGSQPIRAEVYEELATYQDPTPVVDPDTLESLDRPDNLVDRLIAGGSDTRSIGKGVCAAMLGNAVTLVQ
ncbi:MAG: LamG domain-containing protein [Gammaproteobacteria bacterium]|nr:LamG domain-containing protein [Gammaproteobacteria bacterium]